MITNGKSRGVRLVGIGILAALTACGSEDDTAASGGASASATEADTESQSGGDASATTSNGSAGTVSATDSSTGSSEDETTTGEDEDSGSTSTDTAHDDSSTGNDSADDNADSADPTGNDDGPSVICEAPGNIQPCDADTNDPFRAIGLNCPGQPDEIIPIFNQSFSSIDPNAWKIARGLGSYVNPNTNELLFSATEGEQFLFISSGRIENPNANGIIQQSYRSISNSNPSQPLPAPMSPAHGSNNGLGGTPFVNCDLINDCSDSLQAQWAAGNSMARDLLWFQFEVQVPGGTHGFTFDFAYFSVEFPTFIGTSFNDMFVVWSNSETYTGNLCFVNDQPCTVTALGVSSQNPQQQYTGGAPELANTGFDNNGGTGWFEAKASAAPGETLQLTWAVFDMGDTILDTAVIIDNFQWDCEGCVPSEVNPCGIRPIPT